MGGSFTLDESKVIVEGFPSAETKFASQPLSSLQRIKHPEVSNPDVLNGLLPSVQIPNSTAVTLKIEGDIVQPFPPFILAPFEIIVGSDKSLHLSLSAEECVGSVVIKIEEKNVIKKNRNLLVFEVSKFKSCL